MGQRESQHMKKRSETGELLQWTSSTCDTRKRLRKSSCDAALWGNEGREDWRERWSQWNRNKLLSAYLSLNHTEKVNRWKWAALCALKCFQQKEHNDFSRNIQWKKYSLRSPTYKYPFKGQKWIHLVFTVLDTIFLKFNSWLKLKSRNSCCWGALSVKIKC